MRPGAHGRGNAPASRAALRHVPVIFFSTKLLRRKVRSESGTAFAEKNASHGSHTDPWEDFIYLPHL